MFVPFFRVSTRTLIALGRLAAMTQVMVIPRVSRTLPYGCRFDLQMKRPLQNFPMDNLRADTQCMN